MSDLPPPDGDPLHTSEPDREAASEPAPSQDPSATGESEPVTEPAPLSADEAAAAAAEPARA